MNLSAEFLGMLEGALQESYDAGVQAGRLLANEARAEGYAQAMCDVASWAHKQTGGFEPRLVGHVSVPEEPTQELSRLSPAKTKIVAFVEDNPGVTAAEIQRACGGSNSAVYDLHKLGLVSKSGRQFYPVGENP